MEGSLSEIYLLLSIMAAALPAMAYLGFIWWLDRYEREPLWLVALTFGYGATGAVVFGVMGSSLLLAVLAGNVDFESNAVMAATVVAPIVEEPSKALILMALLLGRNFDNTTDGLVYGAATGLGFAMTENFFYFMGPYQAGDLEGWTTLVLIRGSFSALMHCAASATFGAILGRFRHQPFVSQWLLAPIIGYALAVVIHASFNGLLVATAQTGDQKFGLLGLAVVPLVGLGLFFITQLALRSEHLMLRRELEEEAEAGVLPLQHARIIPYWSLRRQSAWLPTGIDKAEYVKAATILAFRRHQARQRGLPTGSKNREIHALRMRLVQLLGGPRA